MSAVIHSSIFWLLARGDFVRVFGQNFIERMLLGYPILSLMVVSQQLRVCQIDLIEG